MAMNKKVSPEVVKPALRKWILITFRLVLGVVFILSGFFKAVDPLGSAYKFTDYFNAFGLEFLNPAVVFFSLLLSAFEFWLGVSMIMGYKIRTTSILLFLTMIFMTPLTLYLAIADPVSDCGCFGDAIVLTNWETFSKNVVLLLMSFFIMKHRNELTSFFSRHSQWLVSLYTLFFILSVSLISYYYLPLIDFRPYKVGTNIRESMEIPEGAPADVYEYTLIYEKDGEKKKFSLEDYPANDSTWIFVSTESKLIKKGYEPPIHDFSIMLPDGEDITDQVLGNPSYTFLMISPHLEDASEENVERINELYDYSLEFGYEFYCLTASNPEYIEEWEANTGAEYPFAFMDEKTLKTIVRSNPGILLLKDGVIIKKWPHSYIPTSQVLDEPLEKLKTGELRVKKQRARNLFFIFAFIFPLLLLFSVERLVIKIVRALRKLKTLKSEPSKKIDS